MKKYIAAGLAALVLCGTGVPAYAAESTGQTESEIKPIDLSFDTIEKTVRENNISVKAYESAVKSAEQTNVHNNFMMDHITLGNQIDMYRNQIKELEKTIEQLGPGEAALKQSLMAQLGTLRASLEAALRSYEQLDDKEEQAEEQQEKTISRTKREMQNAADQICKDAQGNYIAMTQLQYSRNDAARRLAQLDRNIAATEKQVSLGMVAANELKKLQSQRQALLAEQKTLETKYENLHNTLSLQCGYRMGTPLRMAALPDVTEVQLAGMAYEKDLKAALENSYAIWQKQDAADKASDDYMNGVTNNVHAHEAAKIALDAEKENVTVSFRGLYKDVEEKQGALAAAQADLRHAQKTFDIARIQYERGMISKLAFADAQDAMAAATEAAETAEIDLLVSYQNYQWAKRGVMSSMS